MKISKYYLISNLGDKVGINLYYHTLGSSIVYIPNSITLKKPINPDGSKTQYLKFLEKVAENPGIRNKDVCKEFSTIMITGVLKYYQLIQSGNGYFLSECGKKYLDAVHKDGFESFEVCNNFIYDHLQLTYINTGRLDTSEWKLTLLNNLPLNGYIFETTTEFNKFLDDNKLEITITQK